jgi:hypothetical protein
VTTGVPAQSAQRGLWLTQSLDPGSSAYLITHAFELEGALDAVALAQAVDGLIARHDSLRTSFEWRDDDLRMVVHPALSAGLRVEDLTTEDDPETATAVVLDGESTTAFDLGRAPLIRFRLLRVRTDRHVFVLVVHHIVADGVSVEVLWRDLAAAYRTLCDGGDVEFAEPAVRFADVAAREHDWVGTPDYQAQLDFWRKRLHGAPAGIALPDRGTGGPVWRGGQLVRWLSPADTDAVLAFSRSRRVTPYVTLLVVFCGVLHRWTGQSDIVVGSPVTMRDHEGFAEVVGMMANTVALRTAWGDDPTADEAFDRGLNAFAEALANRRVAFDHVVAALPELREAGRSPVVQVLFGYEPAIGSAGPDLDAIVVRRLPVRAGTSKFELTLDCALVDGRLMCGYEWSDQRLDADLVELFAAHFTTSLRFVLDRPDARVGEWPLAPEDEQWRAVPNEPLDVGGAGA